ncbi:MAG: hypothetical protein JNJ73_14665 [Hyphomonadaceae bacterium]|nr:hypothetical protein [Hyphomonadaceae bacterium]
MDDASLLDEVFEMANLSEAKTGIPGVVCISTRQGARVKYFERAGRDQPSFSVSIDEAPEVVVSSLPERVVALRAPQVVAWVRLNNAALAEFWNEGDSWLDEEVTAFKKRLKKVPRR